QKQLQERLRELQKNKAELAERRQSTAATETNIQTTVDELKTVTTSLIEAAKPTPIEKQMIDGNGDKAELPKKPGKPAKGRLLFTERGCLACHSHQGTTKKGDGVEAVTSEANFAPDLSRLVDKLKPGDDGRRWLVQWLLNPSIYHPRTRMPFTHLTA